MKSILFSVSFLALLATAVEVHGATNVYVVLLGGQSNTVGRANDSGLSSPLDQPQNDVLFYYSGGGSLASNSLINLAPGSGTDFGPEVTLGRTLANAHPSHTFALIKHATGGTNLFDDWDPNSGGEYSTFTNTVQSGLQAIIDAGDTPILVGMAWMQGEADAGAGRTQNEYTADLTEFITAVRNDFASGENLPFVIGRLSDNQLPTNSTGREVIQAAQDEVALSMMNVGIVNTDTFTLNDDRHFDATGQQLLGVGMGNELILLLPEPTSAAFLLLGVVLANRRPCKQLVRSYP